MCFVYPLIADLMMVKSEKQHLHSVMDQEKKITEKLKRLKKKKDRIFSSTAEEM